VRVNKRWELPNELERRVSRRNAYCVIPAFLKSPALKIEIVARSRLHFTAALMSAAVS
jgi:hypothetical protein